MVGITALIIFVVGAAGLVLQLTSLPARAALGGAAMALAFVLPHLWFTKETDGYLPLFTIVICAVYALFALGLNIVVGFAGLLDLGYVAFFLVGAYVGAWLMSDFAVNVVQRLANHQHPLPRCGQPKIPGIHLSFWLVIIIAGLVSRDCRCRHRRANAAFEERLPRTGHARLRRDPSRGVPQQRRRPPGHLNLTNGTKGIGPVDQVGMGFLD